MPPWEKYQESQQSTGKPWEKYGAAPARQPLTADQFLAGYDQETGAPPPQQEAAPQQGNRISRAIGDFADQKLFPGPAGSIVQGGARVLQGIAEDPVDALVIQPLTAPLRAAAGVNDSAKELGRGNYREAALRANEGLLAAGETALMVAPGAGGLTSRAATQGAVAKPVERAVSRLVEADPQTAKAATNALRLQKSGQPVQTADLLNRNAQSRLKGAARRDGPAQDLAQDALDPRQADQAARLTRDIEQAFGVDTDFVTKSKTIKKAKADAAAPLYQEAYSTPTKLSGTLTELLKRPPLRKALKQAESLAAIDGVKLAELPNSGIPVIVKRTSNGGTKLEGDTARLHYMRQALDEQIDVFRDKTTGKLPSTSENTRVGKLLRLRRQFNEALREGNQAFKDADNIWSGGEQAEQAMERGLKAASFRTERQVRQLMDAAVKEGDQEFFELGFAQGLIEKVGGSGSDMANRTLRLLSPENQKITREVLGQERGEALLNRLRVENLMSRTRNRISPNVGPDTAENAQQTAAQAIQLMAETLRGNVVGAAAQGAKIVGGRKVADSMVKAQREVDEQLIKLATEDPEELLRLISEVQASKTAKKAIPDLGLRPKGGAVATSAASPDQEARQANR